MDSKPGVIDLIQRPGGEHAAVPIDEAVASLVRVPEGGSADQQVFAVWLRYKKIPHLCKLTKARQRLLKLALRDYPPAYLCALVVYAHESSTAEAKFWRGESHRSEGRTYLDLENLLVTSKLAGRVERAVAWAISISAGEDPDEADGDSDARAAADIVGMLSRRAPGETELQRDRAPSGGARTFKNLPKW